MKKITVLAIALILAAASFALAGCDKKEDGQMHAYYIDSAAGSNKNDGKSEKSAWKSFAALEGVTLKAGDVLYLKGRFDEPLKFDGSGGADAPITVTSYGGDKALVCGEGASSAVILRNQSHIVLSDLEITNDAPNSSGTARRSGISVVADEGVVRDITVRGCDVHDVSGTVLNPQMYYNAGIYVKHLKRGDKENYFDGITIENCKLTDIKGVGIRIADGYEWPAGSDAMNNLPPLALTYEFKNITVRDTEIRRTGADGMICSNAYKPLFENVKCFDAGYYSDASTNVIVALWTCSVDSATFRGCEVARTKFINGDGQAFDTDWGCKGTFTWEYCYTHDNDGGLILRHSSTKGVFRYCVSVNDENPDKTFSDGSRAGTKGLVYFANVNDAYNTEYMDFYNCVFYMDGADMAISMGAAYDPDKNNWLASQPYDTSKHRFTNCVFISRNNVSWGQNAFYSHNAYFGLTGNAVAPSSDANAVTGNPLFAGELIKGENGLMADYGNPAAFFTPNPASPLVGAGATVPNNGGRDYAGTQLPQYVSIGAFETKA